MACYRPGATTFYEIDPVVARIARDPRLFTFLRDCPARIVLGDGRQALARERPPAASRLIVIDAFNSDAIPVHLITREALGLYLDRAGPQGAVLFHISNRYVALEPVLGAISADLGLECREQRHVPTEEQDKRGVGASRWAVLAREPATLGGVATDGRWQKCEDDGSRTWTDDYSDLIGAMSFG